LFIQGFPPAKLDLANEDIISNKIANNSVITVIEQRCITQQGVSVTRSPAKKKAVPTPTKSSSGSPSNLAKRTVIRDGEIMQVAAKKAKTASASGVHTLFGPRSRSSRVVRRKSRSNHAGDSTGTGEGDVSVKLIQALNGASGQQARALRHVFRNAVSLQYNETLAICRLEAARSGNYKIADVDTGRILGSGDCTSIDVWFWSASGTANTRNNYERVDMIGTEMLKAILTVALQDAEGNGKEILKPENMSKCSPRIFWSVVRHFGNDVVVGLKALFPNTPSHEWEFLGNRKRELSEKARMNLLEQQEKLAGLQRKKDARMNKSSVSLSLSPSSTSNETDADTVEILHDTSFSEEPVGMSIPAVTNRSSSSHAELSALLIHLQNFVVNDKVVPLQWLEAVRSYLHEVKMKGAASILTLANLANDEVVIGAIEEHLPQEVPNSRKKSSKVSRTRNVLSPILLSSWIETAQMKCVEVMLAFLCKGSLRVRRLLRRMNIKSLASLQVWRLAADSFYRQLVASEPYLENIRLPESIDLSQECLPGSVGSAQDAHVIDSAYAAWMTQASKAFVDKFCWAKDVYFGEDETTSADQSPTDSQNDSDDCQYLPFGESNCGIRVRVDMDECWWEDGTVVGFIPALLVDGALDELDAEVEEPLWRICLDRDGVDDPSEVRDMFQAQQQFVSKSFQQQEGASARVEDATETELNSYRASYAAVN
jgi:hypothetical protein